MRFFGSTGFALVAVGLGLVGTGLRAADFDVPPAPQTHVDDRAGKISAATESQLNEELRAFERRSSTQIVLSVFRRLPEDVTLEEFTVEAAEAWGVGREGKDNGVVLFLFVDDRKMRIEVGYGLEGAIPDVLASDIIRNVLTPSLRAGDYDGALKGAASALMQAAEGEYRARGEVLDRGSSGGGLPSILFMILFGVLFFGGMIRRLLGGRRYGHHGRRGFSGGGWVSSGGGFSGGGFGGGGFSGGGGSFGGGGASGGW